MKILVAASSAFPRWKGDSITAFVYDLSLLLSQKAEVAVVVPHHPGSRRFEVVNGMKVCRFRYFLPSSLERLCYDGGILPNMRKSLLARLQLPLLIVSEFFAILSAVRKEKPDIIHAHWILPQGFVAALVSKLTGTPFVVTAHAGDVFPLDKPLFRSLSGFCLNSASAITVNSSFTKAAVARLTKKPISVIPMGVNLKLFSSSSAVSAAAVRRKFNVKGKMLLFVGRLAEKKGVTYLISAMKRVMESFPGCKLIIVGDGPEKDSLIRQAQQLGLSGSVIFTGSIPNSQLPPYYKAADIFVLPSIIDSQGDTEGLGVVLLEAIAAGTPVVASNVGGIPDVVIQNKTGLLAEQKNPESLAAAIIKLLKNSQQQKNLSAAAKKHVEKAYSWQKVAVGFQSVFSSVLSGKK